MKYKFSQQQIIGINYYYSKLVDSTFDEDDVRLLLIHLREFLVNDDNKSARGRHNASLLREMGDSIAHTIRGNQSEMHRRIAPLLQKPDWNSIPFTLFDLDEIIEAFRKILTDTGVLYDAKNVGEVFKRESGDLKICLMSMLNGMLFKVHYPGISDDFYVADEAGQDFVSVRTELDLGQVKSLHQLRLNAWIPWRGAKYGQCVLCYELPDCEKIELAALKRTASNEGYCEPIKAMRRNGHLMLATVPTRASTVEVYKVFRASSYDTHPISKSIPLTKLT